MVLIKGQKFWFTENPTEGLWEIEIGYVTSDDTYIVKLTSALRGKKYKYYKLNELYTKEAEITHQLRAFGYIDKGMYAKIIDYIEYIRVLDQDVVDLDGTINKYLFDEDIQDESTRAYEVVKVYVEDNIELFPTRSSNAYKDGESQGVIFDDETNIKKYGKQTIVIHKAPLVNILKEEFDLMSKSKHNAIFEEWIRQGVLFPTETGKVKRYQRKDLVPRDGMTGRHRVDGYVLAWGISNEDI